ncbi:NADase-type glycan-binding domain-containing protein [Nocardioides dongkuii]|uniref:NADase-type glycan-binding domain-containing protein n=1 Tax=Nocardioides dongkuii TaxID=2760089 RepID=UPI0018782157|nr:hypothetical protein [Nocardioides dongkuii]
MNDENPDDWRTGTAERPAVRPPPPPPPPPFPPAPSSARFPLYADEAVPPPAPTPAPTPAATPPAHRHRRGGRPGLVVALATGAVLLAVALGGGVLLLADDDGDDDEGSERRTPPSTSSAQELQRTEQPTAPATPARPEKPQKPAKTKEPRQQPEDVAPLASADVPATAPESTDLDGGTTRYTADRMLDGDPTTAWRMPGDGTGSEITFTLPEPTRLRSVGLVNGYAKTATGAGDGVLDWYAGNRRVLAVEWVLDDGTTVPQELAEGRALQTVRVGGATTSTVVLRLLEVSTPGTGPARRDFTAVSEVTLVGTPAQVG